MYMRCLLKAATLAKSETKKITGLVLIITLFCLKRKFKRRDLGSRKKLQLYIVKDEMHLYI